MIAATMKNDRPFEDHVAQRTPPSARRVSEENRRMLRRQDDFRTAAGYVARQFARIDAVERVALFGSVARTLEPEIPRFAEFRRVGIELLHECRDVDLAVWLRRPFELEPLRVARVRALRDLARATFIGVADHQVDVFLFESAGGQNLGRLCCFNHCPKGRRECEVRDWGSTAFLRQIEGFHLWADALGPGRTQDLFVRDSPGSSTPERSP